MMSISLVLGLVSLFFSLGAAIVLSISLWSLIRPVYVTDYEGNRYRAIIRMAERVPNNGMLYRCKYGIKYVVSREERMDWIFEHQEEYTDMIRQKNSYSPYDKIKVKY